MFIDTHCHMTHDNLQPWNAWLEKAATGGIAHIVNIGTNPQDCAQIVHTPLQYNNVYIWRAVGFQPHECSSITSEDLEQLKAWSTEPGVIAIGEVGLDSYEEPCSLAKQTEVLLACLDIALACNKPVLVHSRGVHNILSGLLKPYADKGLKILIHCFTGNPTELQDWLDMGAYISYAGIVTFKNAVTVQESCKITPLDRLFLETDSPYLAPVPHRGKTNHPALVAHVYEFVAGLRGISIEELQKHISQNFSILFSGVV
jgi:TatD DNase family protein